MCWVLCCCCCRWCGGICREEEKNIFHQKYANYATMVVQPDNNAVAHIYSRFTLISLSLAEKLRKFWTLFFFYTWRRAQKLLYDYHTRQIFSSPLNTWWQKTLNWTKNIFIAQVGDFLCVTNIRACCEVLAQFSTLILAFFSVGTKSIFHSRKKRIRRKKNKMKIRANESRSCACKYILRSR